MTGKVTHSEGETGKGESGDGDSRNGELGNGESGPSRATVVSPLSTENIIQLSGFEFIPVT